MRKLNIALLLTIPVLFPIVSRSEFLIGVAITCLYYGFLVMGFNFVAGYGGQLSFAQAALAGISAYTSAILVVRLGAPVPVGILAGIAFATICGYLLGSACIKITAIYLALATIGFSESIRLVVTNAYEWTNGFSGMQVPAIFSTNNILNYYLLDYYLILSIFIAALFVERIVLRSNFGILLRSVRDDATAASAMGVDTKKVKVYAFTVSALIGGLGGALYAHHVMLVAPTMMALTEMAMILAMTIIGGYGSFSGAVIGPFLVWPITAFLLTITPVGGLPFIILALVMILIQLVAPGGIARYAHLP